MNSKDSTITSDTRPLILEYVWFDGNLKFRSKYRTIKIQNNDLDINQWNYDGSSTFQSEVDDSEIILNPVAFYNNPFFEKGQSLLVLCDTYYERNGKFIPTQSNRRIVAREIFLKRKELEPWFGIEQEYFMMSNENTYISSTPIFFNGPKLPRIQGDYYCGVGNQNIIMRKLAEKHYLYCISAGLTISGINAEVAPNQWEFQIGPCVSLSAGDELNIARYILTKLGEEFNIDISFEPKPLPNPWNGSGLHTNFSTTETRIDGGIDKINEYIDKLSKKHNEHILVYGDNTKRLSGKCETSDINKFTSGIGTRNSSIRIPNIVYRDKKGYLEDRRPASDADPYLVTAKIFDTCCVTPTMNSEHITSV